MGRSAAYLARLEPLFDHVPFSLCLRNFRLVPSVFEGDLEWDFDLQATEISENENGFDVVVLPYSMARKMWLGGSRHSGWLKRRQVSWASYFRYLQSSAGNYTN